MNWRWKARLQRFCAALPGIGDPLYYALQRRFGYFRQPGDPQPMFEDGVRIAAELRPLGFSWQGARVMEVGTGRRVDMPLFFYLCGAAQIHTFDLHRLLKEELALQTIAWIGGHREWLWTHVAPIAAPGLEERIAALLSVRSLEQLLRTAHIDYRAPADAATTGLPAGSIDLQFSYTVFEHIPRDVLIAILRECSRLLSPRGLACHHIDPSDHFAHHDRAIPPIHFLRFSGKEWQSLAGNSYAYHNRLRATDFLDLYREAGHEILDRHEYVDERSLRELREGFPLHPDFRGFPPEELCTVISRLTSRPSARASAPVEAKQR